MGRFIDITGAPIVSDFQEMPLDFMAKALEIKQASKDKTDLELAGLPNLFPDGFIATAGYKNMFQKELKPKLEEWTKRALIEPEKTGKEIAKYKSQLAVDPRYALLVADDKKKADYLKQIAEAEKLGIPFEQAMDYTTGKYKGPIDPDKLLKGEVTGDLEAFYGTPYYGNVNEELLKGLKDIKQITFKDAREFIQGITDVGDQLKGNSSIEISSNTLKDPTIVAYREENGEKIPVTIGELTQKKLMQVGNTWLAGNTVGSKYGRTPISPIMQAPGNTFEEKFGNYLTALYEPTTTYSKSTGTGFSTFGVNVNSNQTELPENLTFNPWTTQSTNDNDFDSFQVTVKTAKNTRDNSWVNFRDNLGKYKSYFESYIPGINKRTGFNDNDAQKVIDYVNSGQAARDYANNSNAKSIIDNLYFQASTYLTNKHQLQFYNNQLENAANKVYRQKTGKDAPKDVIDNLMVNNQYVKVDTGRTNQKTGEPIYKTVAATPYLDDIKETFEKEGNFRDGYVLADKNGNYSKEGFGFATNIFDRVSNNQLKFEGMGAGETSEELDNLYKAKTGESPKGALVPKGTALDGKKITVIVEDKETGKTAGFSLLPDIKETTKLGNIYLKMTRSNDPVVNSVGKQGVIETKLYNTNELYKWDNLLNSNGPITENVLGLNISKKFDLSNNPYFEFNTPVGVATANTEEDLKNQLFNLLNSR